jgi:hypothetical protein
LKDEPGEGSEAIRSRGLLSCLSVNMFFLLGPTSGRRAAPEAEDGFDFALAPFPLS